MRLRLSLARVAALSWMTCLGAPAHAAPVDAASSLTAGTVRVATYNSSLYADTAGGLIERLGAGDAKARQIAAVIQTVRPDVVLLNEFDYDEKGIAAKAFLDDYLGRDQHGRKAIRYRYHYAAPVNTGVASGLDLDRDGKVGGPNDAWGYGQHPGQYGMLVLSRFPIDEKRVRTFREFLWKDLPGALAPVDAAGKPYYPTEVWSKLRLSSKSHWDVPIETAIGTLHVLVSHPTPPVFDGPEDRNGRRNHDEIRFWAEYLGGANAARLYDDAGKRGGLAADAAFVIAGDLNADPLDGDSYPGTMQQLLSHPRVLPRPAPASDGAVEAALAAPEANAAHHTDPRFDTGNFGAKVGNLRIDYVLPSRNLAIVDARVFWPSAGTPEAVYAEASDHHLVWIDVRPAASR